MKIRSLKFAIVAIGIMAFGLILKSCKKVDNNTASNLPSKNELLAALKDSLALHPELEQVIFPINEKVPAAFYDENGKKIYDTSGNLSARPASTYECYPPFMPTTGPSNYATLVSLTQNYNCNQGYSYTVTWNASTPVHYVNTSPFGAQYISQGMAQLTNIGGQVTYQNLTMTPTITLLGKSTNDPTNSNSLYQIVYTTPFIPFSVFSPSQAATLQLKILLYTDCTQSNTYYQSNWSATSSIAIGNTSNPCNRIDPVFVSSLNSPANTPATMLGFGNAVSVGGCPSPPNGNYPDRQEIQVAYAGSSLSSLTPSNSALLNWHDIYLVNIPSSGPGYNSGNTTTQQGTIGCWDVYYPASWDLFNGTPPSPRTSTANPLHGYYYVEWRDWMAAGCRGPWSAPGGPYSF